MMCFMIALIAITSANAQNWIETVNNQRQTVYVDADNIHRYADGSITFWTNTQYKKEYLQYYRAKSVKRFSSVKGVDASKWEALSYTIAKCVMDKNKKTMCVISIADYRSDGSVIGRVDNSKKTLEAVPITPGSLMHGVYESLFDTYLVRYNDSDHVLSFEEYAKALKSHPDAELLNK